MGDPSQSPPAMENPACLAAILIDFVHKKDANYYLQVFSKECKYIEKEKELINILSMT